METPEVDSNLNMFQPVMNQQNQSSLDGPVAILWDIENCHVPSDVLLEDVAGNIRMALQGHPVIKGAIKMFSAYGDFNSFPRHFKEGCQRTGVKLIDVPNGRKDATDKAILVDMFLFALDNPSPSSIMLISGDVDFAPALHILGQRGYMIILVIPSGGDVSSTLCNAGKFVWDWPSVARGEGFVPRSKALKYLHGGPTELGGYFMGCHVNDNLDGQNEEESIVYGDLSLSDYYSRDFSKMSRSLSEYTSNPTITGPAFLATLKSHNLPSRLIEASGCPISYDDNDTMQVQPCDINGLKRQLVKLLESSRGWLFFSKVHAEYQKMFGRPLRSKDYGASRLVRLFKKMGDVVAIDRKSQKRFVYLRNSKASPNVSSVVLERKKKKGKSTQEENMDFAPSGGSSDEERIAVEKQDDRRDSSIMSQCLFEYTSNPFITSSAFPVTLRSHNLPSRLIEGSGCPVSYDDNDTMRVQPSDINDLKGQLVKLLKSSGGCLLFRHVQAEYQKMFGRPLYSEEYGVSKLVDLFKKMGDTMAINRFVYLRNWKANPNVSPVVLEKKEKVGKGTQEENVDFAPSGGSSNKERMAVEEQDDSRNFSIMSQSLSECTSNPSITGPIFPATLRSHSLPSRLIEGSGCPISYDNNDTMQVQPGSINDLKRQLVKLLESSGGCLLFRNVHAKYQKMFGKPLYSKEYGASKLVCLFKKMGDAMAIDGKGEKKFVYLRNWEASPNASPIVLEMEKKGKGTLEENMDFAPGGGISNEKRIAVEGHDDRRNPRGLV